MLTTQPLFQLTIHVGRHMQFMHVGSGNQYSTGLVGWRHDQRDYLEFLFLLYFICCCYCQSVDLQKLMYTDTRNTTSLFIVFVSICRASPQKPATIMHALAVQPPSMFRDLVVPHFRPVPFRSVPLREIVTTFGQTAHASQGNFSKFDALRLLLRQFFDPSSASSVALGRLDSDSTKRLHVVLASFPDPYSRASSQGRTICAAATSDQRYS